MPIPAFSVIGPAAIRAQHRQLTGAFYFVGTLAGLIACGLLGWWHWTNPPAAEGARGLASTFCLAGGMAYYLALAAWTGAAIRRLDLRNPLDLMLARRRLTWTVLALFGPVLLLGLMGLSAVSGGHGLDWLSPAWGSGDKRRRGG